MRCWADEKSNKFIHKLLSMNCGMMGELEASKRQTRERNGQKFTHEKSCIIHVKFALLCLLLILDCTATARKKERLNVQTKHISQLSNRQLYYWPFY